MSKAEKTVQVSVTFRHTEPTETLKQVAVEKVKHCVEKYATADTEVNIILSIEKRDHTVEVNVKSGKLSIAAKSLTDDLYSAIDKVVNNLESQFRKLKDKQTEHHR